MFSSLKSWLARRKQDSTVRRVILIGVDYPSHRLGTALQQHGLEIIAFIDEEPWNHRTKMLGVTVHYPSEVAALAQRHRADVVVEFKGGSIDLPIAVRLQLQQLRVNTVEIDAQMLDLESQLGLLF